MRSKTRWELRQDEKVRREEKVRWDDKVDTSKIRWHPPYTAWVHKNCRFMYVIIHKITSLSVKEYVFLICFMHCTFSGPLRFVTWADEPCCSMFPRITKLKCGSYLFVRTFHTVLVIGVAASLGVKKTGMCGWKSLGWFYFMQTMQQLGIPFSLHGELTLPTFQSGHGQILDFFLICRG